MTTTDKLTKSEIEMIRDLKGRGFAVVVFTPKELDGVDPEGAEDVMIAYGWNYIIKEG